MFAVRLQAKTVRFRESQLNCQLATFGRKQLQLVDPIEILPHLSFLFLDEFVSIDDECRDVTGKGVEGGKSLPLVVIEKEHEHERKTVFGTSGRHIFAIDYAPQPVLGVPMKFQQLPLICLQRIFPGDRKGLPQVFPFQTILVDILNENRSVKLPQDCGVFLLLDRSSQKKDREWAVNLEVTTLKL